MVSKRKVIAFLLCSAEKGGAEINAVRLINGLKYHKYSCVAILTKKGPLLDELNSHDIPVFISKWPHHFGSLSFLEKAVLRWRIKSFLIKYNVGLLHNNSMFSLQTALWLKQCFNLPMLTQWHDDRCPKEQQVCLFENPSTPIVAVSNAVKHTLLKAVPKLQNIKVIHNGIDLRLFNSKFNPENKNVGLKNNSFFTIGFCSRIHPDKGLHLVVKSLALLPSNVKLIVAGKWDSRAYQHYITTLVHQQNLQEQVSFLGFQKNIVPIIKLCNVIAIPSNTEAFPLIVLESLASGVPVVCHPVGGIPEVVSNHKEGLYVEPQSEQAWVKALTYLIHNSSVYTNMCISAFEKSKQFSIQSTVKEFMSTYQKLD